MASRQAKTTQPVADAVQGVPCKGVCKIYAVSAVAITGNVCGLSMVDLLFPDDQEGSVKDQRVASVYLDRCV